MAVACKGCTPEPWCIVNKIFENNDAALIFFQEQCSTIFCKVYHMWKRHISSQHQREIVVEVPHYFLPTKIKKAQMVLIFLQSLQGYNFRRFTLATMESLWIYCVVAGQRF